MTATEFVVGVDEVGRGPLAGPVAACAVCLELAHKADFRKLLAGLGVTDSKRLTPSRRKIILGALGVDAPVLIPGRRYFLSPGLSFALGEVDHGTIDRINIRQASLRAMGLGIAGLQLPLGVRGARAVVLVDGPAAIAGLGPEYRQFPLVRGDSRSRLIALASIIAKEYRDALMKKLSQRYPGYGLESHYGYPTRAHRQAIGRLGPSPIHRRSFRW